MRYTLRTEDGAATRWLLTREPFRYVQGASEEFS